MKGKLIVIDGIDGAGKKTQVKRLTKRLKQLGYKIKTVDFPQYGKPSAALVEMYLNGKFGSAKQVGPYKPSIFFACDRFAASLQMWRWLENGYIIISNRYTSANQIHQAGKIKDTKKRAKFLDWLDNLEFKLLGIPRPNLVIYLSMPPKLGQQLVDKKGSRQYVGGKKRDLHEKDLKHLKEAWQTGLGVAKKYNWKVITCNIGNKILSRHEIAEKVWQIVSKKLKLKEVQSYGRKINKR